MVSVSQVYTSVSCNRTPEILDWNDSGYVCFGAKNAVVVYNTNLRGKDPLTVLSHHKSTVNSVKWLRNHDGSCEMVSCSADKTAAIWTNINGRWKVTSPLTEHKDGVTTVCGLYHGNILYVYTGSIDSTIKVWKREGPDGETKVKHTISLNHGISLTMYAHIIPLTNKPVLFCGLDDHKIHIFDGANYDRVHTLVGHEDWVRGIDIINVDKTTILIASASQDTYIRLWRIQKYVYVPSTEIRVEEKVFHMSGGQWSVKLDAVLAGHEGWVYGVQWQPSTGKKPVYRLLSSSLDKTLIIWEPDHDAGMWTERVRLGEVGGNGLGFYGSRFGPKGERLLAHGYNGSFHMWTYDKELNQWSPSVVCGGHFGAVGDVAWEGAGRYLASTAADQTTRVHAPWTDDNGITEWHEIARPQVHGYDLSSLAMVTSDMFASAAEEKVIRVFTAPHNFITNFTNITKDVLFNTQRRRGPEGASVPSLGLSNKAVFIGDDDIETDDDQNEYFVPVDLEVPPTEETLVQNTLWPETHKLYGHGYEVYAIAASPDSTLLASSCKANTPEHAAVIIWDTKTWQQIQKLESHTLTVTQMEFSPNSRRLLTVSRDRRWTMFVRIFGTDMFEIEACTDKTNGVHARIIWCCAWTLDGTMFSTGGRDGRVCLWGKTDSISTTPSTSSLNDYYLFCKPLETCQPVTALVFAPILYSGYRTLITGHDNGLIKFHTFDGEWTILRTMDNSAAHHLAVKRIAFRPRFGDEPDDEAIMATCGADHFVKIHKVKFLHINLF